MRKYSGKTYNIPTEQAVGTAGGTTFGYDKTGRPFLTKDPKLLLNDNNAGKPEGIQLMIGRRPYAATRWHGTYELFEQRHTVSGEWGGKAADQGERQSTEHAPDAEREGRVTGVGGRAKSSKGK